MNNFALARISLLRIADIDRIWPRNIDARQSARAMRANIIAPIWDLSQEEFFSCDLGRDCVDLHELAICHICLQFVQLIQETTLDHLVVPFSGAEVFGLEKKTLVFHS